MYVTEMSKKLAIIPVQLIKSGYKRKQKQNCTINLTDHYVKTLPVVVALVHQLGNAVVTHNGVLGQVWTNDQKRTSFRG